MPAEHEPAARGAEIVLVTCEHGGRDVPAPYRRHLRGARAILRSHRGWDPGALPVARRLAERLAAPLIASTTTRLLVELNRSLEHPQLHSEYTRHLDEARRREIVRRHWLPHRRAVESVADAVADSGIRVVHLGVHSFVDELDGRRREFDVGLLFDPDRGPESARCAAWRDALHAAVPGLRVAFNQPYLGTDDGLTTTLRARLPADRYLGIEIELRQGLLARPSGRRRLADALAGVIGESRAPDG